MDKKRTVVVIDGQGGGIGKAIIEKIHHMAIPGIELIAVGTNALATSNMLKAGVDAAATGESAVAWNCLRADIIIGAIGIIAAGSMYGELSASMAAAVGTSQAFKILIPISKCSFEIVGVADEPLPVQLDRAIAILKNKLQNN